MKQYKMQIIQALTFLGIFVFLLLGVTEILRTKQRDYLLQPFYSYEKGAFDVVFVGSSRTYTAVLPMELWKNFRITSFNMGMSAQTIPFSYYMVKDAIELQEPELIVLDVGTVDLDALYEYELMHGTIDNMKNLSSKLQLIYDLIPAGDRGRYLFPLTVYHDRWDSLSKSDFVKEKTYYYGANPRSGKHSYGEIALTKTEEVKELPEINEIYLRKIISACQEAEVELLLVALPCFPVEGETDQQPYFNKVAEIAKEENVSFVNLIHHLDELNFNMSSDMNDNIHFNSLGAYKITEWYGNYIKDNNIIPYEYVEEAERWDEDYQRWLTYMLPKTNVMKTYLDKIDNENYVIGIVAGNEMKQIPESILKSLEQLGLSSNLFELGNSYLAVIENGVVTYEANEKECQYCFGESEVLLKNNKNDQSITVNGEELLRQDKNGLGIIVIDSSLNEIVDAVLFDIDGKRIPYRIAK